MTRDRDIERVLETWFAEGSSEMPDRLFDEVVDRIDHVPQRRMARIKQRLYTLNWSFGIATAIAAVLVIAVVGFAVLGRSALSSVASPPSPTPTVPAPSIVPSASAADQTYCNELFFEAITCSGNLAPGGYTSTNFPHRVNYTVPAGWAASWDTSKSYSLERQADFINEGRFRSANVGPTIYLFPDPEAAIQDASCNVTTQPGIGSSPEALATWVANRPGIVTSKPTSIAIGGLTGRMVDVKVATAWSKLCGTLDGHGDRQTILVPYIALVRGVGSGGGPTDRWEWGANRPERQRYIFVDIGGGHTVAIVLDAPLPTEFDQLVADATPIVQTMTFTP
jgi:hypothetical protein